MGNMATDNAAGKRIATVYLMQAALLKSVEL